MPDRYGDISPYDLHAIGLADMKRAAVEKERRRLRRQRIIRFLEETDIGGGIYDLSVVALFRDNSRR